ncbi:MAG: rhodanese-like domain-containing protein [Candidatus Omnitrophota bacterium]
MAVNKIIKSQISFRSYITGIAAFCFFLPMMPHGCSTMGAHKKHAEEREIIKAPKIEITPESWDFGRVTKAQVLTHKFNVKNLGKETLEIKHITTSCGCTTASTTHKKLYAGEATELVVNLDLKEIKAQGKIKRDVYIESNDPKQHFKTVSVYVDFDADIKPKETLKKQNRVISAQEVQPPPKITSKELYSRLQKKEKVVVLDVREENEYKGKHIPNAIWFPKSKFDKQDQDVLKKLQGIDKKAMVVTYCGAGHRSSYVAKKLREAGYNAYNLDGISLWEKENLPLVRGPKLLPSEEPAIIHLEEAYENYYLLFKDIVWVDVRENEDYKRGHVKGALGIPLSEIEARFIEIPQDKEIVLYCEGTWDGGSCEASRSAGRILIKKGYKQGNIKVFEDGYGAWENAGYPVEKSF